MEGASLPFAVRPEPRGQWPTLGIGGLFVLYPIGRLGEPVDHGLASGVASDVQPRRIRVRTR
jgi:hypothetical protein